MKKMIYLAGPISKPNPMHNVHSAVPIASQLMRIGLTPLVPHLSVLHDMIDPVDYEDWLSYDFRVIANCGLLVRIPGESAGADREVDEANRIGVPVLFLTAKNANAAAFHIAAACERIV